MIQPIAVPFARTVLDERLMAAQVGVAVPALRLDALLLLLGDGDAVFFAAGAANVTVPVLQDRQMMDGDCHDKPEQSVVRSRSFTPSFYLLGPLLASVSDLEQNADSSYLLPAPHQPVRVAS